MFANICCFIGLKYISNDEFKKAVAAHNLESKHDIVKTYSGCILSDEKFSDMVKTFKSGSYDVFFPTWKK